MYNYPCSRVNKNKRKNCCSAKLRKLTELDRMQDETKWYQFLKRAEIQMQKEFIWNENKDACGWRGNLPY